MIVANEFMAHKVSFGGGGGLNVRKCQGSVLLIIIFTCYLAELGSYQGVKN